MFTFTAITKHFILLQILLNKVITNLYQASKLGSLPSDDTTLYKGDIHVVDDEQDIVTIATRVLEKEGYPVHSFSDTNKALSDIEQECRKKVRMLNTDIRMPGHSGFKIARRTRAIIPDVPIIFMTAFEINTEEFHKVFPTLDGLNGFLKKPVTMQRLLEKVRKYDVREERTIT